MVLYLYPVGTNIPVKVIENAARYTADSVTTTDGGLYAPLADGIELSGKADCSQALRAAYREAHPDVQTRLDELETLVAELFYGGESK